MLKQADIQSVKVKLRILIILVNCVLNMKQSLSWDKSSPCISNTTVMI